MHVQISISNSLAVYILYIVKYLEDLYQEYIRVLLPVYGMKWVSFANNLGMSQISLYGLDHATTASIQGEQIKP